MSTKYKGNPTQIAVLDAYITLQRAANTLDSVLLPHLTESNLTGGQFGVLEALFHLGSLAQCDLGKKNLSSKGNITTIIDNLEKRHLVQRVAHATDRRLTMIKLTATGKKHISKIIPAHVDKITQAFSVLSMEELKELKRLCKKVGLSLTNKR